MVLPGHVVNSMLGHTEKVAEAHYLMVTDEHYRIVTGLPQREGAPSGAFSGALAAQNPAQQPSAMDGKIEKDAPQPLDDYRFFASRCKS
jgi:hypothetical protein